MPDKELTDKEKGISIPSNPLRGQLNRENGERSIDQESVRRLWFLLISETFLFIKHIVKQKTKDQQLIFWIPSNECCYSMRGKCKEKRAEPALGYCLGRIKDSSKWVGKSFSQPITMTLYPLVALYLHGGRGDPPLCLQVVEGRVAYSEIASVRFSILIFTDGLDVILVAMNRGVDIFAGVDRVSAPHHAFTVSVIPALWFGIRVLG